MLDNTRIEVTPRNTGWQGTEEEWIPWCLAQMRKPIGERAFACGCAVMLHRMPSGELVCSMTEIKGAAERCASETGADLEQVYVEITNELVHTSPIEVIACGVLMLGERSDGGNRLAFYFDGADWSRTFVADEDCMFFEVFEAANTIH